MKTLHKRYYRTYVFKITRYINRLYSFNAVLQRLLSAYRWLNQWNSLLIGLLISITYEQTRETYEVPQGGVPPWSPTSRLLAYTFPSPTAHKTKGSFCLC